MWTFLLVAIQMVQIERPPGWTLTEEAGRVLSAAPDGSAFVAVEPVGGRTEGEILERLAKSGRVGPVAAVAGVVIRGSEMRLRGQWQGRTVEAQAMAAVRGGQGTLYLVGATAGQLKGQLPQLVRMLESLRLGSSTSSAFQRQTEPREQAYSVELPQGWRTEVGLFRAGAFDIRTEASAVTDGATIFLGDRNLGRYVVPDQFMASLGFREGSLYDPSGISPMMVLRYLPGAHLAQYWLGKRLPGARMVAQRDRPDIAQQTAQQRYRAGNVMRATLHAGGLEFEFQGQRGEVIAVTEVYPVGDSHSWTVVSLYGYFAAPAKTPMAREALAHALGTLRLNLNWLARERRMQREEATAALETMQYVNNVFKATMAERSASSDQRARVMGDLLSGTYRVVDPVTGETATVQAGANFYYRVLDPNHPPEPVNLRRLLRIDWD